MFSPEEGPIMGRNVGEDKKLIDAIFMTKNPRDIDHPHTFCGGFFFSPFPRFQGIQTIESALPDLFA